MSISLDMKKALRPSEIINTRLDTKVLLGANGIEKEANEALHEFFKDKEYLTEEEGGTGQ